MSSEAENIVQRLINAWDCCGTCAGDVLASYAGQVRADERRKVLAELREAALAGDK